MIHSHQIIQLPKLLTTCRCMLWLEDRATSRSSTMSILFFCRHEGWFRAVHRVSRLLCQAFRASVPHLSFALRGMDSALVARPYPKDICYVIRLCENAAARCQACLSLTLLVDVHRDVQSTKYITMKSRPNHPLLIASHDTMFQYAILEGHSCSTTRIWTCMQIQACLPLPLCSSSTNVHFHNAAGRARMIGCSVDP